MAFTDITTAQRATAIALASIVACSVAFTLFSIFARVYMVRRRRRGMKEITRIDVFAEPLLRSQVTMGDLTRGGDSDSDGDEPRRWAGAGSRPPTPRRSMSEVELGSAPSTRGPIAASPPPRGESARSPGLAVTPSRRRWRLPAVTCVVPAPLYDAWSSRHGVDAQGAAWMAQSSAPTAAVPSLVSQLQRCQLDSNTAQAAVVAVLPAACRLDLWRQLLLRPAASQSQRSLRRPPAPGGRGGGSGVSEEAVRNVKLDCDRMINALFTSDRQREFLGQLVVQWLANNPACEFRQGFASIAAVVLAVVQDASGSPSLSDAIQAEALDLLQSITDTFMPHAFGAGDQSFRDVRMLQFSHLLAFWDPELAVALGDMGVSPVMFAQSWMTALFAHSVSIPVAASFWDVMFSFDERFVLFMGVALLIQVRTVIAELPPQRPSHAVLLPTSCLQIRTQMLACTDVMSALQLIGQLSSGSLAIDVDFYAKKLLMLWSYTPRSIGRMSHAKSAPTQPVLPLVSLTDLGRIHNAACVVDVRNCSAADHATLAASVAPVRCLHCPLGRLLSSTHASATVAAAGTGAGAGASTESRGAPARGSTKRVQLRNPPAGADDATGGYSCVQGFTGWQAYEQHVAEAAPHVWAVKGMCLALYGGASDERQVKATRDILTRARFFCLCRLALGERQAYTGAGAVAVGGSK